MRKLCGVLTFVALGWAVFGGSVFAQAAPGDPSPRADRPTGRRAGGRGAAPVVPGPGVTITPQQIQTLFDGMVLSRAQAALQLTDSQFVTFIPKLLSLQKGQQRHRQTRQSALAELRRLTGPNAADGGDEASLAEKTRQFDDLEVRAAQDQQKALDDLDTVLTPRQRARFRVFLETMEREKVALLVRAQQGRSGPPPSPAK